MTESSKRVRHTFASIPQCHAIQAASKEHEVIVVQGRRVFHPTSRAMMARNGYLSGSSIGSGSYSKVKIARDVGNSDELVAVKIIDRALAPADYQQRFLPRELRYWPDLKHPNIVGLLEVFQTKRRVYMVLEYASGGDMLHYVQRFGYVDESRSRLWFGQVCSALRYVHSRGLAHRDVKLENVLLTGGVRASVKIADFGFVCRSERNRLSATYCGSRSYAAPEILAGLPYDPKKADVWAAGVVLYIFVTGRMPFNETRGVPSLLREQRVLELNFEGASPIPVSAVCRNLVRRAFHYEYASRTGISGVLADSWFRSARTSGAMATSSAACSVAGNSTPLLDGTPAYEAIPCPAFAYEVASTSGQVRSQFVAELPPADISAANSAPVKNDKPLVAQKKKSLLSRFRR